MKSTRIVFFWFVIGEPLQGQDLVEIDQASEQYYHHTTTRINFTVLSILILWYSFPFFLLFLLSFSSFLINLKLPIQQAKGVENIFPMNTQTEGQVEKHSHIAYYYIISAFAFFITAKETKCCKQLEDGRWFYVQFPTCLSYLTSLLRV